MLCLENLAKRRHPKPLLIKFRRERERRATFHPPTDGMLSCIFYCFPIGYDIITSIVLPCLAAGADDGNIPNTIFRCWASQLCRIGVTMETEQHILVLLYRKADGGWNFLIGRRLRPASTSAGSFKNGAARHIFAQPTTLQHTKDAGPRTVILCRLLDIDRAQAK